MCWEDGKKLPVKDGFIILNRRLEEGDRVLLLRVQHGQKFIVLSRIFEGGSLMPTLPTSAIDLSAGVSFVSQPSRTWYINKETNRIQGECDGWYSVRQAVEVILNVERFRWQIYSPYSGMQWDGLIGQDPGYVASELQRRITEALKMDDQVRGSPALRMPWKGIC